MDQNSAACNRDAVVFNKERALLREVFCSLLSLPHFGAFNGGKLPDKGSLCNLQESSSEPRDLADSNLLRICKGGFLPCREHDPAPTEPTEKPKGKLVQAFSRQEK